MRLRRTDFLGSPFDKSEKIDYLLTVLAKTGGSASVLDFGASFGYMLWQLRARGVANISGYELSRPRARFGRERLGVHIADRLDDAFVEGGYDLIYTSHVLEHMGEVESGFRFFERALRRPGGRLVIWVPNASEPALARHYGGDWGMLVGEPHPLAFTYDFFKAILPRYGIRVSDTGDPADAELRLMGEAT